MQAGNGLCQNESGQAAKQANKRANVLSERIDCDEMIHTIKKNYVGQPGP